MTTRSWIKRAFQVDRELWRRFRNMVWAKGESIDGRLAQLVRADVEQAEAEHGGEYPESPAKWPTGPRPKGSGESQARRENP